MTDKKQTLTTQQQIVLNSNADVIGFGGNYSEGCGKTHLIFEMLKQYNRGLYINSSSVYPTLEYMYRTGEFKNYSFNFSNGRLESSDNKYIKVISGVSIDNDPHIIRGYRHDILAIDNPNLLPRKSFDFIKSWTTQKTVLSFGTHEYVEDSPYSWLYDYFAPWMAYLYPDVIKHPDPAKSGEIRYYTGNIYLGRSNYVHESWIYPVHSRTFISLKTEDNIHLGFEYRQILNSKLTQEFLYGWLNKHKGESK